MSDRLKYLIVGILSLGIGFAWAYQKNKQHIDNNLNQTVAKQRGDKYFLVFNSIVVLSREISKDQYDKFLSQYPSGKAPSNVLNNFSTPTDKYVVDNGIYYEYKWDGNKYITPIEITKEEYLFLTGKNTLKVQTV